MPSQRPTSRGREFKGNHATDRGVVQVQPREFSLAGARLEVAVNQRISVIPNFGAVGSPADYAIRIIQWSRVPNRC